MKKVYMSQIILETAKQTEKRLRPPKYFLIFISCIIGFWGTYLGSYLLGQEVVYAMLATAGITTFLVYLSDQTTDLFSGLKFLKKGKSKDVDSSSNRNDRP